MKFTEDRVPLPFLKKITEQAENTYPVGSRWRHYRGQEFVITGFTVGAQRNDVFVRFAYPEDCKVVGTVEDGWGLPKEVLSSLVDFSIPINLWEEPLKTEAYEGPRFSRIE